MNLANMLKYEKKQKMIMEYLEIKLMNKLKKILKM